MNGICLIIQKKPLFSVTLFRAWFYDNRFSKIKFNPLKTLEQTRALLVKLQAFIPQFN